MPVRLGTIMDIIVSAVRSSVCRIAGAFAISRLFAVMLLAGTFVALQAAPAQAAKYAAIVIEEHSGRVLFALSLIHI